MAQTKTEILAILATLGMSPRHRFGQNFMIDTNVVRSIVSDASIGTGDLVIEVGAGTGTLTEELLQTAADVVAVEIDRDLAKLLRQRFENHPRFQLIEGDALAGKHSLNPALLLLISRAREMNRRVLLVANLPFNIASPLVIELLLAGVDQLTFVVQREVGERLRASPATPEYGPISVTTQMLADVAIKRILRPSVFFPPPKVDSAVVHMTRADRLGPGAREFAAFVQKLFSSRRKTLRKALVQMNVLWEPLESLGIDEKTRAESLAPEMIKSIFDRLRPQPS